MADLDWGSMHHLGPIKPLLTEGRVRAVIVNGLEPVQIEIGPQTVPTNVKFSSTTELVNCIEELHSHGSAVPGSAGRTSRLPDGTVVHSQGPPAAAIPSLAIRKPGMPR